GNVSTGFKPVVTEHCGYARRQKRGEVVAIAAEAKALEEDVETLVTRYGQQIRANDHCPQQFTNESEHGHSRQQTRATHIQRGRQHNHSYGDGNFGGLADMDAEKLSDVRRTSDGH